MTATSITCFKAYDVRGRIPDELNDEVVYRIGRAFVSFLMPGRVVVGRDIRNSSAEFCDALCRGLQDGGADVLDIGLCGTEEVYFATAHTKADGGIMVTASHNPPDYNGLKFVREESRPISGDNGLQDIRRLAEAGQFAKAEHRGERHVLDNDKDYIAHLLSYIEPVKLRPLRIVVNAGNGGAGKVVDLLEPLLPFEFIKVHHEPDGNFPNGVPNPMLEENRKSTIDAIIAHKADLGIAWDGDYDRCFLFDEHGGFIEGYYIVGLLAQSFLQAGSGERIVYDPRLTWNTIDVVRKAGGVPVMSKAGHAFIKEAMRKADAVYGGEMSAHHYFRDFSYCDSGMIPWLLIAQILCESGKPLSSLVRERKLLYPISGEINRKVKDAAEVLERIEKKYAPGAVSVDHTDGLAVEFEDWRFNVRPSNTEPLLRLNVESRNDEKLMRKRTRELLEMIEAG